MPTIYHTLYKSFINYTTIFDFLCTLFYRILIFQVALKLVGSRIMGYGYATLITIPINVVSLVFIVTCYLLSIKKLEEHQRNQRNLSSTDRNIVFIAKLYLYVIACCFTPTLVWQLLMQFVPPSILAEIDVYLTMFVFFIIKIQSTISAIVFMRVNQASKQKIREIFERHFSSDSSRLSRNRRRVHPQL